VFADIVYIKAVLRRFGHNESFLRVSFQDESRSRLFYAAGLGVYEPVGSRFLELMVNGFQLAGRTWEFLGYSMSGLRDHSVWFVTPFQIGDVVMDAARIRGELVRLLFLLNKWPD
jgi:RNA-dependent RNA polymerase